MLFLCVQICNYYVLCFKSKSVFLRFMLCMLGLLYSFNIFNQLMRLDLPTSRLGYEVTVGNFGGNFGLSGQKKCSKSEHPSPLSLSMSYSRGALFSHTHKLDLFYLSVINNPSMCCFLIQILKTTQQEQGLNFHPVFFIFKIIL